MLTIAVVVGSAADRLAPVPALEEDSAAPVWSARVARATTAAGAFALYAAITEAFRGRQLRELALQVPNQERKAAL